TIDPRGRSLRPPAPGARRLRSAIRRPAAETDHSGETARPAVNQTARRRIQAGSSYSRDRKRGRIALHSNALNRPARSGRDCGRINLMENRNGPVRPGVSKGCRRVLSRTGTGRKQTDSILPGLLVSLLAALSAVSASIELPAPPADSVGRSKGAEG